MPDNLVRIATLKHIDGLRQNDSFEFAKRELQTAGYDISSPALEHLLVHFRIPSPGPGYSERQFDYILFPTGMWGTCNGDIITTLKDANESLIEMAQLYTMKSELSALGNPPFYVATSVEGSERVESVFNSMGFTIEGIPRKAGLAKIITVEDPESFADSSQFHSAQRHLQRLGYDFGTEILNQFLVHWRYPVASSGNSNFYQKNSLVSRHRQTGCSARPYQYEPDAIWDLSNMIETYQKDIVRDGLPLPFYVITNRDGIQRVQDQFAANGVLPVVLPRQNSRWNRVKVALTNSRR